MWPVSAALLEAILTPHRVTLRADVSKGGVRLYSDLPVLAEGSEVIMNASQRAISRWQCELQVAPRLTTGEYTDEPALPRAHTDPLGHYGQEIALRRGVVYPNGVIEWVPLGVYRIDD